VYSSLLFSYNNMVTILKLNGSKLWKRRLIG
jgi:hypothetical protein